MLMDEVIEELVAVLALVPGIQGAGTPKDAQNEYPFIVVYPGSGTWNWGTADGGRGRPGMYGPQQFNADCHIMRANLEDAVIALTPMADEIATRLFAAFHEHRFNDTVHRLVAVRWNLSNLGWGSDETIGYRIMIDMILQQEVPSA